MAVALPYAARRSQWFFSFWDFPTNILYIFIISLRITPIISFLHLIITIGIPTIRKGSIWSPFICNLLHWSAASTLYPTTPLRTFKLQRSRNAWQTLYITQEDLAPRISSRDWSLSATRWNGKTARGGKTGLWPHENKRLNKPSQNLSDIIWKQ
jgi:hypothetical protein